MRAYKVRTSVNMLFFTICTYHTYPNFSSKKIINNNNISSDTFTLDKIDRLVFSDDRTDVSIEDSLTFQSGFNDLDFDGVFNLRLNKITKLLLMVHTLSYLLH